MEMLVIGPQIRMFNALAHADLPIDCSASSSRENLDNSVSSAADNPATVLTPDDSTHALAAHNAVGRDLLGAGTLLEGPEPE